MASTGTNENNSLQNEIKELKEAVKSLEKELEEPNSMLLAMGEDLPQQEDLSELPKQEQNFAGPLAQLTHEKELLIRHLIKKDKEMKLIVSLLKDKVGIEYTYESVLSRFKIQDPKTISEQNIHAEESEQNNQDIIETSQKIQQMKEDLEELKDFGKPFGINIETWKHNELEKESKKITLLNSEKVFLEKELKRILSALKEVGIELHTKSGVSVTSNPNSNQEEAKHIEFSLSKRKPKPNALEAPFLIYLSNVIFNSGSDLKFDLKYYNGLPEPNKDLGSNDELNKAKALITPYATVWRNVIRNLMSKYELIDIYRGPSSKKPSIIRYRRKDEAREEYGVYPVFSRAYFKLWEMLDVFGVLNQYKNQAINIACLAEGPGGFIHSLIDWRAKQNGNEWDKDNYCAITLRIMESDGDGQDWNDINNTEYFNYVKKKHSLNLSYGKGGEKGTGNLLEKDNLIYFRDVDLAGKKCELVTADGGIHLEGDDSYSVQELANAQLFFVETLYALNIQAEGGSFILKIYDIFYDITVELLQLLSFYYAKVAVTKPLTSRPANSEKYIVAEGFKGIKKEDLENLEFVLFDQWFVEQENKTYLKNQQFLCSIFNFSVNEKDLKEWEKILQNGNEKMMRSQIKMIEEGIQIAELKNTTEFKQIPKEVIENKRAEQKDYCILWCERHGVPYRKDLRI